MVFLMPKGKMTDIVIFADFESSSDGKLTVLAGVRSKNLR